MKTLLFALVALMMTDARAEQLYLTKVYSLFNETGPYILTCRFFDKKVEITEFTGDASSIRFEPTTMSGTALSNLVKHSWKEPLFSVPFNICDGGSYSVMGHRKNGSNFILKKFEDCGQTHQFRKGAATHQLLKFVEKFCPSYVPQETLFEE